MSSLKYTIIKDQDQYELYCEQLELLAQEPAEDQLEEIELLSLLIDKYNDEQMEKYQISLNPVEFLKELLVDNNLSQLALAKRLDVSPQLINDILKYRREITKSVAYKLGEAFKVKYMAFLKPYKLEKAG